MTLTHAGYAGPGETKYLFIDGGCLRTLLNDLSKTYFYGTPIELDFAKFTSSFTKVFYYDALPVKKSGETEELYQKNLKETEVFIEKLQMLDRFHVYLGESRHRRKRTEQKQVDMLIAIHLLKHSFNRNMHKATLLTTDSDFIPLLDALVEAGMHISLWYGDSANCKANKKLLMATDSRIRIGPEAIYHNTTKNFSSKYTFPIVKQGHKESYTSIIDTWEDPSIGQIELYQQGRNYVVVFINKNNLTPNIYFHIQHSDLKILRLFVAEEYNISVPIMPKEIQ